MTTVLVCGGRKFDDWGVFTREMVAASNRLGTIRRILHGGASGADTFARHLAKAWQLPAEEYAAEWSKYGRSAGPIRNQRMLDEGKPDFVVAFPGGRGTADMVQRARAAGVEVVEVSP